MSEKACLLCGGAVEDEHHVAGRRIDPDLTAPVCADCHQRQHEDMRDAGVHLDSDHTAGVLGRLVSFLRSLGAFFAGLAEALLRWADEIARAIEGLCDESGERFGWAR